MCGIAGIIGAPGSARAMIDTLTHRGPDGVRTEDGANLSLAHARLSIIDLQGGWQPLHAAGCSVVGNGEIYNYRELIEEFDLKDKLRTGSDFEPLLHLYAQEGEKVFDRLRGMYAFCLIGHDGKVWLVRDPFGIKPLYVRRLNGAVAFASEPRAFGAPESDARIAEMLAALNYSVGHETAWRGISRVPPGAILEFTGGELIRRRTRAPIRALKKIDLEENAALAALDTILQDSVRVHQRSDVPYGLFLSGGIDSATIAAMMARLNERPVIAYTCGFEAPGAHDERAQAEKVARALDLDWRETLFTAEDFWRIAPRIAWALDDPTTDYACLPTYKLAEAAKEALTVILTGEGGDELFAGYGRYRRALRPAWLGGRAAEPQIAAHAVRDGGVLARAAWRKAAAAPAGLTPLQAAQWADIATWLPNDLLLKLDRCLMAHGLEGRTPFLDPEVAAFAFNLPDKLKVRGRMGKVLLRKWLEKHCPAADPWARKRGFTVPVAAWIAPRAAHLCANILDVRAVREAFDEALIRQVFADEARAAQRWPLLFTALWSLIHLEGEAPDDAMASLLLPP